MTNLVKLDTKRLLLRPWQPQDDAAFGTMNADPRVMAFYPAVLDSQQSRQQMRAFDLLMRRQGWGVWVLQCQDSGSFVGFIGLFERIDKRLSFAPCVELVWRLAFSHWGRGLAFEGACAVIDFAFSRLSLDRLVAFTACQNKRSLALMLRLGMEYERDFTHPALPVEHNLSMHSLYYLSRNRWLERVTQYNECAGVAR